MKQKFILLPIGRNLVRKFSLDEVLYLEADNSYTKLKTLNDGHYIISRPLGEFEKLLCTDNSPFFRIGRSTITNLKHAEEINSGKEPHILLANNVKVVPDKNKVTQIIDKLILLQSEPHPPTS